jgi:carboxymethylenebutenolidase
MGFCMGGALSFASACHVEGLSAVVPFYGIPPAEKVDYAKVTAPILAHVARKDEWVSVAKAEALKGQLEKLGKSIQLEIYDADHAFVNDTRPEVYHEANAKLAWKRSVDFLKKNLS